MRSCTCKSKMILRFNDAILNAFFIQITYFKPIVLANL